MFADMNSVNTNDCRELEEEEKIFAKKAGCQKGLQPINAGYRKIRIS